MAATNKGNAAAIDRVQAGDNTLADDVDKIRDIIFGGQMRQYARRFDLLEESVTKAADTLERNIDKRVARLEDKLAAEVAGLRKAIEEEGKDRQSDTSAGNESLAEVEESMTRQLAESRAALSDDMELIRDKLEALVKETRDELTEEFTGETSALGRQKVAAADLAGLMQDVAKRLLDSAD